MLLTLGMLAKFLNVRDFALSEVEIIRKEMLHSYLLKLKQKNKGKPETTILLLFISIVYSHRSDFQLERAIQHVSSEII